MSNNFFTICSFFYSLMLTIIYFRRKNIGTLETKIYSKRVSQRRGRDFLAQRLQKSIFQTADGQCNRLNGTPRNIQREGQHLHPAS